MTLTAAEAASGRRSEAGCYPRFLATGREPRWRAEHPKEDLACSQWLHPAHNHTRTIHTGAPPARVCKGTLPRCPLPPSAPLRPCFSLFGFSLWSPLWCQSYRAPRGISAQFSRSLVSDSLRPHEPQGARPPCPSPTPEVYSNSCPSSR